jgi:diguanylate cyclase (GGDEF)-like protein
MALGLSVTTFNGVQLRVTSSVGVASLACSPKKDKQALIALADQRLYRAKESGRNRVVGS